MIILHARGGCGSVRAVPPPTQSIDAAILRLVDARGPNKSICPSEAARALDGDWRAMMGQVREAAIRLARAGRIDILRKGRPIDPADVRGVIRLRTRALAGE